MKDTLNKFFRENKIEYYSVLRFSDCRLTSPAIMEREAFTPKSVILYLLPYYTGDADNLSRYAASLDYHLIIREIGDKLIECIRNEYPEASARSYGDHSPIDEVGAALISGLGVVGDNGLLINERYGSYVFIGDVITDLDPDVIGAEAPSAPRGCLHCGACLRACPTRILSGEGEGCLSAITQRKGDLNEKEVELMRKFNTVWGCDECQSACPYNRTPETTPIDFFYKERIPRLTRQIVEGMSKAEFSRRAFAWRGKKTLLRNLALLEDGDES